MILTPAQRKALERSLATANAQEQAITYMEKLASVSPGYAQRVKDLRDRQQYLIQLAQVALAADSA